MKYGTVQHLRYLFNYSRAVVHLQADLSRLPQLKDISPYTWRELRIDDNEDLRLWLDIVNDAYDETDHDMDYAKNHMSDQLFLNITKVFLILDRDLPIGTISIGTYKSNNAIGGVSRIAVKKKYRGKGLGTFLIALGYHKIREMGIKYGESIVTITRDQSIMLHFRCGFVPQMNRKYIQYKNQKRHFIIRALTKVKLMRLYRQYLNCLSVHFLSAN